MHTAKQKNGQFHVTQNTKLKLVNHTIKLAIVTMEHDAILYTMRSHIS